MVESKRNYYVYMHYFPDKKSYIGLTRQKPEDRWSNGSGYKKQPVYSAIKKFGWGKYRTYYFTRKFDI